MPQSSLDLTVPDAQQAAPEAAADGGRHRPRGRHHGPATALTAFVATGAMALAAYAAVGGGTALDADRLGASVADAAPEVAGQSLSSLTQGVFRQQSAAGSVRIERIEQSREAVQLSVSTANKANTAAEKRSAEIAAWRVAQAEAQERRAAEAAAQKAAEQEAAEQAAAEQAAAQQQQAASRSEERAPAPAPVYSGDPRSIARSMLGSYGWSSDQFGCLDSLWMRESGWNPNAENPSSGAYGIPQSLPGSKMATAGSDWRTNPATQIRWGLGYISGRYGTPCGAWAHSESHGWY